MDYRQTLEYLFSRLPMFQRTGGAAYKANLDNTITLCKILGNPERTFNSVHIAGTNGKGSVAHFVASILQEAGYKVGLFTSPHLKDFRERIRINEKKISEEKVIDFVKDHIKPFEKIKPSFFEYTFGMAAQYFAEGKVDIAVMETGMGGRLDSTNVVKSILSVITNIGFDHTQFLGDTLEKIAKEKAGIIKPGIPVIIGETQKDIVKVFQDKAAACGSEISFADQDYKAQNISLSKEEYPEIQLDIYRKNDPYLKNLRAGIGGTYQVKNIVTALKTINILNDAGYPVTIENIRNGFEEVIKNTGLQGRWQILKKKPLVICDTGHNIDGISEVVNQIKSTSYNNLHFVLGMVNDKEVEPVLEKLPRSATYYFCKANIPRGLDQEILRKEAFEKGLMGECYNSVQEAYLAALESAEENDLVFIGGSTYVVAEVL